MARLYELLVTHAGANPKGFTQFITVQLQSEKPRPEYRFQGSLGFGGKLNYDPGRGFTVTCYSEDLTPERERIMLTTNLMLHKNGFNNDRRYAP